MMVCVFANIAVLNSLVASKKKKSRVYLWGSLCLLALFCATYIIYKQYHPAADAIFKKYSGAIALIETYDKKGMAIAQGSGVVVSNDGLILTNNHVIKDAYSGTVTLKNGIKYDIDSIIRFDEMYDLATIKIKYSDLPSISSYKLDGIDKVGEKVYCIGNPVGLTNTLSEGIVSAIREDEDVTLIQTTAPISHGSSGGAMFNSKGELIGITTITLQDAQNINFAIPIKYAFNQLFAYRYLDKSNIVDSYAVLSFLNTEKQIIDSLNNEIKDINSNLENKLKSIKDTYGVSDKKAALTLRKDADTMSEVSNYQLIKEVVDTRIDIYNKLLDKYKQAVPK